MATNLATDNELISEARRIGHHKTKEEAVTNALLEYIRRRKQLETLELVGKADFYPDCDYKAARMRRGA